MALVVKQATKRQARLKACLVGPSGSGKTFTALTFARELAGDGKIMVLDSEKGSASLYSDVFHFDVAELWARDENRQPIKDPFHPDKYMEAIKYAEDNGYAALVIDSLTHVWNDEGGFLDLVNRVAISKYHNKNATYQAWNDVDPLYRKFLNAITDARLHIVCTMRSKTDTAMETDDKGKTVVKKYGTKAIQRENLEYEFTVFCQMELDNTLIVEKTRCSAIAGSVVHRPTGAFIKPVKEWLNNGAPDDSEPSVSHSQTQQKASEPDGMITVQSTNGATMKPTNDATSRSTGQPTTNAPTAVKPPVVNPSTNNGTTNGATQPATKTSTPNETQKSSDIKPVEGQSEAFTGNSHDPVKTMKQKVDELYNSAEKRGIVASLIDWQSIKIDAFGTMVADEAIKDEAMYETLKREVIKQARAKKTEKVA